MVPALEVRQFVGTDEGERRAIALLRQGLRKYDDRAAKAHQHGGLGGFADQERGRRDAKSSRVATEIGQQGGVIDRTGGPDEAASLQ
jgi:hypothetical protein